MAKPEKKIVERMSESVFIGDRVPCGVKVSKHGILADACDSAGTADDADERR
jgi:hypothetical protein